MAIVAKKKYVSLKKSDSESSKLKPLTPESKELKPLLKRISPAEALAQKGLKTLKPAPKELKPLIPKKKVFKSLKKTTDLENDGPLYVPTHFRKKEPKLSTFTGSDEKFSYSAVREKIKKELKTAVLEDADFLPMTWGFDRPRMVLNAPTLDTFRYYVEINDPDVFQYDLALLAEQTESIEKKLFELPFAKFDGQMTFQGKSLNTAEMKKQKIRQTNDGILSDENNIIDYGVETEVWGENVSEPVYLGNPPWYSGFVDDTWINYWSRQSSNITGKIAFSSGPNSLGKSISVVYRANNQKSTLWIAKNMGSNDQFAEDVVIVRPEDGELVKGYLLKNLYVYADIFDHIIFKVNSGEQAKFNKFEIKLNGEMICKSWDIKNVDQNITHNNPYDAFQEIYKWKQRVLDYPSSPVLRVAANELGRAWCAKWKALWEHIWCTEFASWVIRRSTMLEDFPVSGPENEYNMYYRDMLRYFIPIDRFVSREMDCFRGPEMSIKYNWDMLDEVVKPGFYASILNGNHSCIFVDWIDHFVPQVTPNKFRAIGGNQGGTVNIRDRKIAYEVGINHDNPKYDICWKGNITNWSENQKNGIFEILAKYLPWRSENLIIHVYDGFGITDGNG